jgi:hypothetical protein
MDVKGSSTGEKGIKSVARGEDELDEVMDVLVMENEGKPVMRCESPVNMREVLPRLIICRFGIDPSLR